MPDDHAVGVLKEPPHSHDAEQAVLGALLLADDAFERVADRVAETDFYSSSHRLIFRNLAALARAGKPLDMPVLVGALEASGELANVGGMQYLGSLLAGTMSAANVAHYAGIVRERAILRQLIAYANDVAEMAYGFHAQPVAEIVDEVQRRAMALAEQHAEVDAVSIGEVLRQVVDDVEKRAARGGELPGKSTGLSDLNEKTTGYRDGDLIIIAGRPSSGKTALAMQAAVAASIKGEPALIFSLEMSPAKLGERAAAHVGHVNSYAMRSGKMDNDDWTRLSGAIGKLNGVPLFIDGSPRLSVERLRARARRHKRKHGLSLVVVDYVQLMDGRGDNRNEEITGISRGLKLLANELECPVIALSQLNRKCEERTDKRPMLSDLRDSGAVEQDADMVLFVYREEMYQPNAEDTKGKAEIIIGKQRDGATGRVYCTFLGEFCAFADTAWTPAPVERGTYRGRRDLDD